MRTEHLDVVAMPRRDFLRAIPGMLKRAVNASPVGSVVRYARQELPRIAVLDVHRCLAYDGAGCQQCYIQCPRQEEAIVLDDRQPVIQDSCDGCGECVTACRAVNDPPAMVLTAR